MVVLETGFSVNSLIRDLSLEFADKSHGNESQMYLTVEADSLILFLRATSLDFVSDAIVTAGLALEKIKTILPKNYTFETVELLIIVKSLLLFILMVLILALLNLVGCFYGVKLYFP